MNLICGRSSRDNIPYRIHAKMAEGMVEKSQVNQQVGILSEMHFDFDRGKRS